ncbi:MAG: hypothetical protein ACQERV_10310 [Bacteroidota bacterium]
MKRKTLTMPCSATGILFLIFTVTLCAQVPATFNYQAVLRDTDGNIRADAGVNIDLILHQGSSTGTAVYEETHSTTTTSFGLVSLEVGSGDPAAFALVDWAAGPYFLEVKVDDSSMGTTQLLSVPYALYAAGSEFPEDAFTGWDKDESDDFSGDYEDLTNKPASFDDADADPENELQTLEIAGNTISLSPDGGSIDLPPVSIPDNSVTSDHIVNGTITNADISSGADIAPSKINGIPGIEYTGPETSQSWTTGQYETKTLATITMTIPTAGYVLLIHSGVATFFGQGRRMYAGVGTSASTTTYDVMLGYLDGSSGERFNIPYTASGVFSVTAGTRTFYATAHGSSTFDNANLNMTATSFSGIFFPIRY